MSLCDVFVKIGGSVLDDPGSTSALVPHLAGLGRDHRVCVMTGGGQTVKRMKANQKKEQTDFYNCWRAGVLCLEVNANLLASYSTSFAIVSSAADFIPCFEAGRIAVLAPSGVITSSLYLTPDWRVTTDSMGLYFAHELGAQRYVIVSDVNGMYTRKPEEGAVEAPIAHMTAEELAELPSSKLDTAFQTYFRRHPVSTIIVNGRHPARVAAAIRGEPTIGTRITPSQVS